MEVLLVSSLSVYKTARALLESCYSLEIDVGLERSVELCSHFPL
jgi:hypothetical protein